MYMSAVFDVQRSHDLSIQTDSVTCAVRGTPLLVIPGKVPLYQPTTTITSHSLTTSLCAWSPLPCAVALSPGRWQVQLRAARFERERLPKDTAERVNRCTTLKYVVREPQQGEASWRYHS